MSNARRARGTGGLRKGTNGAYIARFTTADGERVKRSTGTTDRKDAEAMLAAWIQREARIGRGLEAPGAERVQREAGRPLREHLDEYLEAFERAEARTAGTMRNFIRIARTILRGEPRLKDLTPDLLERVMHHRLKVESRSARTANTQRQYLCAFAVWATADGRADLSQLAHRVKRRKEDLDRRRERRALTDAEANRLVSGPRGLVYRVALETGLRRNELKALAWPDIDLERRAITVTNTKSRRIETVPIVTDALRADLAAARPLLAPGSRPRVFASLPTHRTVRKDLERAGVEVVDQDGKMVDFHALRTTLGSRLARAGVVPQVAKEIMRHTDYRTTVRHYHHLTLNDQREALEKALAPRAVTLAEGTSNTPIPMGVSSVIEGEKARALNGTLRGAKSVISGRERASASESNSSAENTQPLSLRDFVRALAERCETMLDSAPPRTVGAVGQQSRAQVPSCEGVAKGAPSKVHNAVHNAVHNGVHNGTSAPMDVVRLVRALARLDDASLSALLAN
jgi:integrase